MIKKEIRKPIGTAIGDQVMFRPGFSAALDGIAFEVDDDRITYDCVTDPGRRRPVIGIRTHLLAGGWSYRLAYLDDLVTA